MWQTRLSPQHTWNSCSLVIVNSATPGIADQISEYQARIFSTDYGKLGQTNPYSTTSKIIPPNQKDISYEGPGARRAVGYVNKRPRADFVEASLMDDEMDERPSNSSTPRELTQNPLKKIWMPNKNGLPEKHISQRKGVFVFCQLAAIRRGLDFELGCRSFGTPLIDECIQS